MVAHFQTLFTTCCAITVPVERNSSTSISFLFFIIDLSFVAQGHYWPMRLWISGRSGEVSILRPASPRVIAPLAAIVMNGNAALRWLALDPPNLAKARNSAELIIRDGDRASQIIARIRALLKKSPPSKTLLDVNEFVNEVVGLTQSEMVRNSVRLGVEFADALPRVPGDRIQLQQVLLNLIVNAVEAMLTIEDRQRALLIATDIFDNTGVRVAVSDNGLGIDPQTAARLFDAFSTTKPEGMGMKNPSSYS